MILLDTNVMLDVLQGDGELSDWSQQQLEAAAVIDGLAINPVIYAEMSIAFARIEELNSVIEEAGLKIESIPNAEGFLAGKAFLKSRQSSGTKHSVLPDFFIGAHAAVRHWPILTRDTRRYRAYFPTVQLVAP